MLCISSMTVCEASREKPERMEGWLSGVARVFAVGESRGLKAPVLPRDAAEGVERGRVSAVGGSREKPDIMEGWLSG